MIYRRFMAVGIILLFAACSNADKAVDIAIDDTDLQAVRAVSNHDMRDFSKELLPSIGLSFGIDRDTAEAEIRTYFGSTASSGAVPIFNTKTLADGEFEILATRNGLADDSVKSEQLLAHFADGVLVDYGMRIKCHRGDNPDVWTIKRCP